MNATEERFVASDFGRIVRLAAAVAIVLSLGLRAYAVFGAPLNEDEIDALYHGWLIGQGDRMYVDWIDVRMPLTFYANAMLLKMLPDSSAVIVAARAAYQLLVLLALAAVFSAGRRLARGVTGAALALAVFSLFEFQVARTAQVRPDVWVLLFVAAAFAVAARFGSERRRAGDLALTGLCLAGAVLAKQSGVFPAIGIAAFVAAAPREDRRASAIVRDLAILTGSSLAAFGLFVLALIGWNAPSAIEMIYSAWTVFDLNEADRSNIFILLPLALHARILLVALLALVMIHPRIRGRRPLSAPDTFLAAQAWCAAASILVRGKIFEQDLIYPALVLSLVLARVAGPLFDGLNLRRRVAARNLTAIAFFSLVPFLAAATYHARLSSEAIRHHRVAIMSFYGDHEGMHETNLDPVEVKRFFEATYMKTRHHPSQSLATQRRQMDWLLDNVSERESVMTGNNMPIFRHQTHNVVRMDPLRALLGVRDRVDDPSRLQAVCRVEPATCRNDLNPGERAVLVLEMRPPRIIVLDYAVADLIFGAPEVFNWVAENYQFRFHGETLSFVAYRKGPPPLTG
ncbi:glycosyltransferase family 39 protein [bacterium]|nr:glycosyltransferase family 39 protein [bacterium]